jgi:hypothetical protein
MIELFSIIFMESPIGLSAILATGLGIILYMVLTDNL